MTSEIYRKPKDHINTGDCSPNLSKGTNQVEEDLLVEGLFRKAFDCLYCHAAVVDQNGVIIAVNQAWRDLFKSTGFQEKFIAEGVNYVDICERSDGGHLTGGESFGVGLRAVLDRHMDRFELEYFSIEKENIRWFLGKVNGLDINGMRYAFVLHQDISDYKNQSNQSLSKNTQLPTLLETVKSLVSMLDLQELLNNVLIKLSNLIRYNSAVVFEFSAGNIIRQAYQGPPLPKSSPKLLVLKGRYPEVQKVVSTKRSFFIQNINHNPALLFEVSKLLNLDQSNLKRFHSWLFLPMMVNENQIGMMALANQEEAYYDDAALSVGQLFAHFAAIAIQNAHLYELSQNSGILKERNRLAYELHDSIAQSLYSINLYANAAQRALEFDKYNMAHSHLHELKRLSSTAVNDMRLMIFELNNNLLEEFGIARAIESRFEAIEAKQGIKTDLKLEGQLALPDRIEREVFGLIQDVLIYIERTAAIKALSIKINTTGESILITIRTDQIVDPQKNREDVDIARFNRIRNRVRKIGGKLEFNRTNHQETVIRLQLDYG